MTLKNFSFSFGTHLLCGIEKNQQDYFWKKMNAEYCENVIYFSIHVQYVNHTYSNIFNIVYNISKLWKSRTERLCIHEYTSSMIECFISIMKANENIGYAISFTCRFPHIFSVKCEIKLLWKVKNNGDLI